VGGVDWARRAVLDLLAAGKDVVTANKALLAVHGAEVFDAARRHERAVAFEASVAGGIPIDAAHKLAILVKLAFGVTVPLVAVAHRGIRNIQQMDLRYANELGYKVKLVAEAWQQENQLALHVSPLLVRHMAPLAQVRNTYNAIHIVGDVVGDTLYYGRGAGQM